MVILNNGSWPLAFTQCFEMGRKLGNSVTFTEKVEDIRAFYQVTGTVGSVLSPDIGFPDFSERMDLPGSQLDRPSPQFSPPPPFWFGVKLGCIYPGIMRSPAM
jgi:hypothetical protein